MPPKKAPAKTTGLLHFFNKQQQERERIENQKTSHVDDDDSCQIVYDGKEPGTSAPQVTLTPKTPKNQSKWAETLGKTTTPKGSTPAGRDWLNPFPIQVGSAKKKNNSSDRKNDLIANGFDEVQGEKLFYPIDEPIRSFEINLVKCAAASNCCIALPASAPSSSSRISSTIAFNFLKWFPSSRVLIVSNSENCLSALRQLSLEKETTKVSTLSQFKNMKTPLGRVLFCTTSQCALKVVESAEARQYLKDIRLVIMDLKPNECCTKYKPILTALTVKETFFRCVILTTAVSNASRRTASITKRQLMITNLLLSDWIEQSETDFSFRSSNIPAGVEVKTWKSESCSSEKFSEILLKYEEFCRKPMEELAEESVISSKSLRKLLWICWKSVKSTEKCSEKLEKLELAELLTTTYKLLVIDGVVAARNFAKQHSKEKLAPKLQETTQKILEIFGGFSEFPAKFQLLSDSIEQFLKRDNHLRGVVLCRDPDQAAEIQNFLEFQISIKSTHFVRIVEDGTPTARNLWQISRISTVFHDNKSPKILIIPVKIRDFVGFSDQLPVNELTFVASVSRESLFNYRRFGGAYLLIINETYERLRKDDGRLIDDDGKSGQKDSKNMKLGAVERYEFKFESSRLRLDSAQFPIRFFNPRGISKDSILESSRLGKTQVEMTSKDHSELANRLKNPEFSRFQTRKRPFCVIQSEEDPRGMKAFLVQDMNDDQLIWNQDVQYLGDVKSSKMSHRITKYLKVGKLDWAIGGDKRRYQYINEISDSQRVLHLDRLLQSLDSHFVFSTKPTE